VAASRIGTATVDAVVPAAGEDRARSADAAPVTPAAPHARRRGQAAKGRSGIWLLALRDLQWRRRRFGIAIAGTALVFAMTLLLSGLAASFRAEVSRTIGAVQADAWVVRSGITGPFTALATIPTDSARKLLAMPGVRQASPLIVMHQVVRSPETKDVNLFGYQLHGLGEPPVARGRLPLRPGEATVDDSLKLPMGTMIDIGGRRFRVVGFTHGMTLLAGAPNVYLPIADAQAIAFEGRSVTNVVLVRGVPAAVPPGLQIMNDAAVRADVMRPLENPISAIDMVQFLLWIVAVTIIGAVVYLSALERVRDFAVLKATGYSTRSLLGGLAVQAVLISVGAVAFAMGIARLLAPTFPMPVEIQPSAMAMLPVIGIAVGLIASLFGVRRAGAVDPALAFGGP